MTILLLQLNQHRSILNLDLESTERDPIILGVSYFYLKFLKVDKKLHLKHFDPFSDKSWFNMDLLITFHLVNLGLTHRSFNYFSFGKSRFNIDLLITFHLVLLLDFYYLIN